MAMSPRKKRRNEQITIETVMVTQPSSTAVTTVTAPSANQTVVKGSTASGYGMSHQEHLLEFLRPVEVIETRF
ncbi:hypothetical protein KIN20_014863 [Parelaphostrongylus tenuis]|uniref:Uncharacterized protein n=1 Tax=Parelaphostrongylus tenuis TaxID=148309 RepID=A0AAD5MFB8_PARTN|nr:hypothetical protein KIN20_014863 [Parelaphostrongylus tenuis]